MDFLREKDWWLLIAAIVLDSVFLGLRDVCRMTLFADANRLRLGLIHVVTIILVVALVGFFALGFMRYWWIGGVLAVALFVGVEAIFTAWTVRLAKVPEKQDTRFGEDIY